MRDEVRRKARAEGAARPPAILHGDSRRLSELLAEPRRLAETARKSALTDSEFSELKEFVIEAMEMYEWRSEQRLTRAPESTLHEIAEPLERVIALLKHKANYYAVLVALDSPVLPHLGGPKVKLAKARYRRLLADLREIALAAPPPEKRGPGKRPDEHFHDLIRSLAAYWKHATGKPFRQGNYPARFVLAAVEFIDPARTELAVTKQMEKVVTERRKFRRKRRRQAPRDFPFK